jgi:hypothetical protein
LGPTIELLGKNRQTISKVNETIKNVQELDLAFLLKKFWEYG